MTVPGPPPIHSAELASSAPSRSKSATGRGSAATSAALSRTTGPRPGDLEVIEARALRFQRDRGADSAQPDAEAIHGHVWSRMSLRHGRLREAAEQPHPPLVLIADAARNVDHGAAVDSEITHLALQELANAQQQAGQPLVLVVRDRARVRDRDPILQIEVTAGAQGEHDC